jgi:hypothetical protein
VLLFALGEAQELFGVVQENGALGLGLGNVDAAGEDADFGLERLFNDACAESG